MNLPRKTGPNLANATNYSYLSGGMKTSATNTSSGEGLVYRGPMVYRQQADGTLTLDGVSFGEGRITPAGVRYYVCDHLGSVKAVVDGSTGAFYTALDYDEYGAVSTSSTVTTVSAPAGETFRTRFTGQEDQGPFFGLPYNDFGARHYSPAIRRWLVPDPMSEDYYDISPYAYCANNPVNLVDSEGRYYTDYFDCMGHFLISDGVDNGIIKITDVEVVQIASSLSNSIDVLFLNENSVTMNAAFSYGLIDDNSALTIYEHYNKTGLPLKVDNTITSYFELSNRDDINRFMIFVNTQKSLTPNKNGFTLDNYNDIQSALNIHEGQGHYQRIKELGPIEYSKIPSSIREIEAIKTQMNDSSWEKTTSKFKNGIINYLKRNLIEQVNDL